MGSKSKGESQTQEELFDVRIAELSAHLADINTQLAALRDDEDDPESTDVEAIIAKSKDIVLRRGALERVKGVLTSQISQVVKEKEEFIRMKLQLRIDELRPIRDQALEKLWDDLFDIYQQFEALVPVEGELNDLYDRIHAAKSLVDFRLEAASNLERLKDALRRMDGFKVTQVTHNLGIGVVNHFVTKDVCERVTVN